MIPCPMCAKEMAEMREEGAVLRKCVECRVVWIGAAELVRFLSTVERRFLPVDLNRLRGECDARRRQLTTGDEKAPRTAMYPPCPECGEAMNRRAFAEVSGIRTNVCVAHGSLFFDDGFRQAVEFIARGGELLAGEARLRELSRQVASLSAEVRSDRDKSLRLDTPSPPQIFFLG